MAPNSTESNHAVLVIEKLVNTIAEKEGFISFKSEIKQISTHGANYTSDLYLVNVLEEGKDSLNLFAKANIISSKQTILKANEIFKHEVFVYTAISDAYHKLQERHGVPEDKRFKFPKYYGSNLTDMEEVIIFENLQAQGFVLHDRFKPLDWEYAKAGVEELAKFHALSFALENEDPELFDKLVKNNKGYNELADFESLSNMAVQMVPKNIPIIDSEHRSKIENFFNANKQDFWAKHFKQFSKYSTLVHGDYRMSNILVKYQDNVVSSLISKYTALSNGHHQTNKRYVLNEEKLVSSLKPVDYQGAFYGCPLIDLVFFLFTGTDEEFRRLHFEQIIEHYHNSLADHLKLLSRDINDIYPKSTFYFELKDKLLYGLEMAISLLSIVFIDPNAGMTIDDMQNADTVSVRYGTYK